MECMKYKNLLLFRKGRFNFFETFHLSGSGPLVRTSLSLGVSHKALPYFNLKDKSGVDKVIVNEQSYQLLNTNREFFPSFDASNFHKYVNEFS